MKHIFIHVALFGIVLVTAQTTTIPGLGKFQPQPVEPIPEAQEASPVATPVASRGVSVNEQAEGQVVDSKSLVKIGQPETMDLLDNSRTIKIGDRLEFMVAEDREPPAVLFVSENGTVDVPLVGKVQAVNKTARMLAKEISDQLEVDFYYQATVHVAEHRASRTRGDVFVVGQVQNQGMVPIPQNEVLTVSRAILSAGGWAPRADPTRVVVTRKNPADNTTQRMEINVADILEGGQLDKDLVLQPNDWVNVAPRGDNSGTFTITGAIRSPGSFAMASNQELYLSQAILQAGGLNEFGDGSDVKLIRYDENDQRIEKTVNVNRILEQGIRDDDVLVQPGDQIIVDEKWISF